MKAVEFNHTLHWFFTYSAIKMKENRPMDKKVLAAMMAHINKYFRRVVLPEQKYSVMIDRYSLQKRAQ